MPNVKPGDMAKIVCDPHFPSNVGAMLLVVERAPEYEAGLTQGQGSIVWLCKTLQPLHAYLNIRNKGDGVGLIPAGNDFVTLDIWLRRIDPPANEDDVYDEAPNEHDVVNIPNRLAQHDKEKSDA